MSDTNPRPCLEYDCDTEEAGAETMADPLLDSATLEEIVQGCLGDVAEWRSFSAI